MSSSLPAYRLFVAVDIAAASFAASCTTPDASPQPARCFAQSPEGFAALQDRLRSSGIPPSQTLVAIEASGSYWVALAVSLHQAGFAVAVLNPAHVHNYARSLPRRSKTDALDAQLLALFARERQPPRWTPPAQVYHELHQRLVARDGLLTTRQQLRNQRHALDQWPIVIASGKEHLDTLIGELASHLELLEAEISQVLRDGAWAETATLLQSISGIGTITTGWLLVGTLNFQSCASAEQAAAYVGLAPLAYESGSSVRGRPRIGHRGQVRLRRALYLATLSADGYNPLIKAYYQRLRAAGKRAKVARCAAARKLLQLAFAVVRNQQPFDPA